MSAFVFQPPAQIQVMRLNRRINISFYNDLTGKIDLPIWRDTRMIVVDMQNVNELSRFGFLSFYDWVNGLCERYCELRIHLKNCPSYFMTILRKGSFALPKNVFFESFFADYQSQQAGQSEDYLLIAGIHFVEEPQSKELRYKVPEMIVSREGTPLRLRESVKDLTRSLRDYGILSRFEDHAYGLI